MPRLPIAIAFVAGLACATLLGAAAPRGKPITWEYQLLDVQQELVKLRAAADARVATTRASFPDDNHARSAATLAVEDAWMAQLSGDGWLLLGELLPPDGTRKYLLAKPSNGAFVRPTRDAEVMSFGAVKSALEQHELDWKAAEARDRPGTISAKNPYLSTDFTESHARMAFDLTIAELERCGSRGTLVVPWSRESQSQPDRCFSASLVLR